MYFLHLLYYFLILAATSGAVSGEGGKPMRFKAPSEEDIGNNFLPAEVKCDGCRAVVYQLNKQYSQFNAVHKQYKLKLPESELIDLTEQICSHDTYKEYGLKEVEGVRSMTGEGLKTVEAAGVVSGGGKWPGRLVHLCTSFVEELGEDGIYNHYLNNVNNVQGFEDELCRGTGIFGSCNKNVEQSKVKKSSKRVENEL